MEKGNHSMERVRLPLQYTIRQSGTRGRLISHFYWWEDRGMPSSPSQMEERFHQMVWSGAKMPQLTGEILHLLYHRRESRLRHYRRPSGTNGSTDERLRHLLPRGMLFRRLQPHRLPWTSRPP